VIRHGLGTGAFGVVYLAHDEALQRLVALKVPLPQAVGDSESRRRFEAEAAAAARLDHPGIVAVYEADFGGPTPYIASAYCPGPDLSRWLEEYDKPVPWCEAASFMAELADAVAYAHGAHVFHRDLKPSNVMLMPREIKSPSPEYRGGGDRLQDFSPQLTDFGLAKCALFNDRQTRSSMILGTPLYMAPEQLESARNEWPVQADIYSLGCILYELLTRQLPIMGETYAAVLERLRDVRPVSVKKLAPDVPEDLATICERCLEKNPEIRYASAEKLADDLRACVDAQPISASRPSFISRLRYLSTRPQRIIEAGWYMMCVQLLLSVWVGISLAASSVILDIPIDEMMPMFAEFCALILTVNLPMIAVGWYTTQRKPWAVRAGLFLSIVNLAAPILFVALSRRMFFAGLYTRVDSSNYFAFAVCALVFLAELGQLVLYSAAWAAQRHAQRR
jgi:serine/threonine protein kinase